MNVSLRHIRGPWEDGWVLDKHTLSSVYMGEDQYGHPQFETTRTEAGEATYLLKYKQDRSKIGPLAHALADYIYPRFPEVGFIVPMPATTHRPHQPVTLVAKELGTFVSRPVFTNLLMKTPGGKSLKDLHTKEEKLDALENRFRLLDAIPGSGPWNALILDDLYHTGATMESACTILRSYSKVNKIYVAAFTWRP